MSALVATFKNAPAARTVATLVFSAVMIVVLIAALVIDLTVNNSALFVPLSIAWCGSVLGVFLSTVWFLIKYDN